MNKYPAPAPQQYGDYEDDDGPGLGTLGAALAAGALLTPIGRPVRALAKKGLGKVDDKMFEGAGGKYVGKTKAAAGKFADEMWPVGQSGTRTMVDNIREELAKSRNLELGAALRKRGDFAPDDFAMDTLGYNAGRTWKGIKTPTTGLFKHLFAERQPNLPLNVDPVADLAATRAYGAYPGIGGAVPGVGAVHSPAAKVVNESLGDEDVADLIASLRRDQSGYRAPTLADNIQKAKSVSSEATPDARKSALELLSGVKYAKNALREADARNVQKEMDALRAAGRSEEFINKVVEAYAKGGVSMKTTATALDKAATK